MNKATIIGMILVIALMVSGMSSCSSVTTPADSGSIYTTSAQPTVVIAKTVPVVVSRPTAPVIINPYPAPPNWWQNWRWPWHPRP